MVSKRTDNKDRMNIALIRRGDIGIKRQDNYGGYRCI